jgi:translocation and assembly module TamB
LSEPDDTGTAEAPKGSALPKAIVAVAMGVAVLLAALFAATRYGVLLPQARLMIEARTDGLKLGGLGKLKIEGLSGDIWRDFRVRRLTIRDEKGVWLEADGVHLVWRYGELLFRRFHADSIDADRLVLIRRPTLAPKGKAGGLPVSFYIDEAHARVELQPSFSLQRGVYDLALSIAVNRGGGMRGEVEGESLLNPGDHATVQFDLDEHRPLVLLADAAEAHGGALAGALGLPPNKPFLLRIAAGGRMSAGRFTAMAMSGAEQPLDAGGAWTPEGGLARGRLQLSASTLTAPYAARFGPEVRFWITGQKAAGGLSDLTLQAEAQNLSLRARGLGDLGERRMGPKGVTVSAATPALSKITGGPEMGPARVAGVLTGEGKWWRFAGEGAVGKLVLGDYSLEAAEGPLQVSHDAQGWAVKAKLAGRGGRGAGWVAAVLGGAPKADLDGSRMADGRLSLRSLQLEGAGLKLQASGGRGLLGGLTFKGDAQVSNLAAAHAGAAGSAQIAWSAAQARSGDPWTLKADATADRFATGYPELDRLLGPRPKLSAQGAVQGRRVSLAKAGLAGAALEANAAGVLGEDGKLSLKLDWNAQGPFHAGPVEIAGRASGGGAVTGTLAAPRADLMAQLAEVDIPRLTLKNAKLTLTFQRQADGSSGMIAATADSAYGPARGRADFRFPEGGVDLTGLSVDAGGLKAQGSLSLRKNAPSAADLTLAAGPGAFLEAGRLNGLVKVTDSPGGARAQINLSAEGLRTPGSTATLTAAHLTAEGPLARLPYALNATGVSSAGRFTANGKGLFSAADPGYQASFEGSGRLGGRDLHTLEPAVLRFGGPERSARLRLASSDGGHIDLDGRLTGEDAQVRAQLAGVGLNLLDEDLAGKVDATLTLSGHGGRLDGGLEAKLSGARGRGVGAASGVDSVIRGTLTGPNLTLEAQATNGQGLKANATLVLPTETSAAPFRIAIARQQPLHGRIDADGEVRPLWDLLVGGERSLSGRVQTQATLSGTLAEPRASGQVTVAGGRFDDGGTGLSLRNVAIKASFAEQAVDVTEASGVDGRGGTVSGSGRISLAREGVSSFRLDLHQFRLIDNEQAVASASGQATINRAANGQVKLSGALTIDRADVAPHLPGGSDVVTMDVIEKNRPAELVAATAATGAGTGAAAPQGRGQGWALDVGLNAPARVFLRGRGLNVELSLDAHVGGTTAAPALSGTARVIRGDYNFAGKRFEFDNTSVVYLATRARDIRLDLSATRDDPTLTAVVRIRGTAAKPEITFSSTPSLPSDEVLSQVLFGASASQLSPVEAAQLASALSAMAGGGGLDVIGNLRSFAGLDRLAFGGTQATGVTVSGGKYVTDKVYIELTGGGKEGPLAQVEWRVRRELSIISRLGGQAGSRMSVRWRRDY